MPAVQIVSKTLANKQALWCFWEISTRGVASTFWGGAHPTPYKVGL